MRILRLLPLFSLSLLLGSFVYAQESGVKQADEAIVRVNSGIVLRSTFDAALRESLAELKTRGFKGEDLEKRFNDWKPLVLDQLINRLLLIQQATALSINVRPEVDRLLLQMMMENGCESMECLGRKLREVGFDLEDVRRIITENLSINELIDREVYGRIRRRITEEERREAYGKNKASFTDPEGVRLKRLEEYLTGLRLEADIEIDPRYRLEYLEMKPTQIKHAPDTEGKEKKKKKIKRGKSSRMKHYFSEPVLTIAPSQGFKRRGAVQGVFDRHGDQAFDLGRREAGSLGLNFDQRRREFRKDVERRCTHYTQPNYHQQEGEGDDDDAQL